MNGWCKIFFCRIRKKYSQTWIWMKFNIYFYMEILFPTLKKPCYTLAHIYPIYHMNCRGIFFTLTYTFTFFIYTHTTASIHYAYFFTNLSFLSYHFTHWVLIQIRVFFFVKLHKWFNFIWILFIFEKCLHGFD